MLVAVHYDKSTKYVEYCFIKKKLFFFILLLGLNAVEIVNMHYYK